MHIHQGHWSLSSSAWWTLLCNNQLIYILPSTAICVDYWEKAKCVCVCICVCMMLGVYMCTHFSLSLNMSQIKLDELIWHTVLLDIHPNIGHSCLSLHTHTDRQTHWHRGSIHICTYSYTHTSYLVTDGGLPLCVCVCVCVLYTHISLHPRPPPSPLTPPTLWWAVLGTDPES